MSKLKLIALAIGATWAAAASATPISGTSLQTTLTGLGATVDVQNDQVGHDQMWAVGATSLATAKIQFELSAYANGNSFGIYDADHPGSRLTLYSGSDGPGTFGFILNPTAGNFCTATFANIFSPTCAAFSSNNFGFFLTTPAGNTFFSDSLYNSDGVDHMVAFEGGIDRGSLDGHPWLANEYLLAWEDLFGGGDRDYDDFAVLVESVIGVPEPSSIAVFGLGLLAAGFVVRRRTNRQTAAMSAR